MSLSVRGFAARQLADYRARRPGTLFAEDDHPDLTLGDAYTIQAQLATLRTAEGEPVAGYKIGCTGPGTREQFGMDGPIRGFLYSPELHSSGAKLSYRAYANLAIEGEMAVRLGEDAEITRVFPVIELHNYVFRSKTPNLQELIANNGLHAGVVLPAADGAQWRGDEPLAGVLRVTINGEMVEEGPVSGVPGGPAGSVEWLRGHLPEYGLTLRPRQLILTGTPLGLIPVRPGDSLCVTAEGLGTVYATVLT
ncbi:fumarylacetoacetate hydrolase family protein [soil metagenome]